MDQIEQEPTPNLRLRQRQPTSRLLFSAKYRGPAVYAGTQSVASNLYNPFKLAPNSDSHSSANNRKLSDS
ncbi:hypothetical protein A5320_06930 [Rheinheimera sp. SA_1]|nr:hypothetical protein A5320_06930 [Rheinheimera sp. SA_1]